MVGNVEESRRRLGKAETLETGEARARCFAAKSRRRLAQMLLIQVTEVKGSLGAAAPLCTTNQKPCPYFQVRQNGSPRLASPAPRLLLPWRPRQEGQKRLRGVLKPRSTDSEASQPASWGGRCTVTNVDRRCGNIYAFPEFPFLQNPTFRKSFLFDFTI